MLSLFLAAVGVVNIVTSLPSVPRWVRAARGGGRAVGVVTAVGAAVWWGGRAAVIHFEAGGQAVEIEALPISGDEWPLGEAVPVRYPAASPESGILWTPGEAFRTWSGLVLGVILMTFAGLLVSQVP